MGFGSGYAEVGTWNVPRQALVPTWLFHQVEELKMDVLKLQSGRCNETEHIVE
jgi:hypothetical protein